MKSQAKVKQQRRIRNIHSFCDNPMSLENAPKVPALAHKKVSKYSTKRPATTNSRPRKMNRSSK